MSRKDYINSLLGVNAGSARNTLFKKILFSLIQELHRDNCYRCSKKIQSFEELSIDHKIDWIGSSDPKNLYFDISNIAFSHERCNVKDVGKGNSYVYAKSGYKGVYSVSDGKDRIKPWSAQIAYKKKKIHIGKYSSPEEAAEAYDTMAIKMKGPSAITNKKLGLI